MVDYRFLCSVRSTTTIVRGYQCDNYQHMNNARYLEVLEDARWNYLDPVRKEGFFERNNLIFLVVNININYRFPAVMDDVLETDVEAANYGRASMTVKQRVFNKTQNKISADAEVTFVLYDTAKGRPAYITDEIKKKFDELAAD